MTEKKKLDTKKSYAPQIIGKVLALLECFSLKEYELTAAEIGRKLGLSNSSLYRYLVAMENEGYLERDPTSNRYVIGLRVVELAGIALQRLDVRRHGQLELDLLADNLDMNANLGVLYRGDSFHMAFAVRTEVDRMYSIIGRRIPAHCSAMGKAILAHMPRDKAHEIVELYKWRPLTDNSTSDFDKLDAELDDVLEKGYSVDRGEVNPRTWCIAAPVRDQSGVVIAAISVSSARERVESSEAMIAEKIIQYVGRLSMRLGYNGSNDF